MYNDEDDDDQFMSVLKILKKKSISNDDFETFENIFDEIQCSCNPYEDFDSDFLENFIKLSVKHNNVNVKQKIANLSILKEKEQFSLVESKNEQVIRNLLENTSCSIKTINKIEKISDKNISLVLKQFYDNKKQNLKAITDCSSKECIINNLKEIKLNKGETLTSFNYSELNAVDTECIESTINSTDLFSYIENDIDFGICTIDDIKCLLSNEHCNHNVFEYIYKSFSETLDPFDEDTSSMYMEGLELFLKVCYKNKENYPKYLIEIIEKDCLLSYSQGRLTRETLSLIKEINNNAVSSSNKETQEIIKLINEKFQLGIGLNSSLKSLKETQEKPNIEKVELTEFQEKLLELKESDIDELAADIVNTAKDNDHGKIGKDNYILCDSKEEWMGNLDDYELLYYDNRTLSEIGENHTTELLKLYLSENYEGLDFSKSEKYLKTKVKAVIKNKIEEIKNISVSLTEKKNVSFAEKLKETAKTAALNSAIEEANNKLVQVTASTMTNIGLPEFISNDETFKQILGVIIPSLINWGVSKSDFFSEQVGSENLSKLKHMSEYALKSSSEKIMKPFIEKIVGSTELKALAEPMKKVLSLEENKVK